MSTTIYQVLASALSQATVSSSKISKSETSGKPIMLQSALPSYAPTKPIILLNKFPVILNPNHYTNAKSTANPNGDLCSLWRFRQLVDPLPQSAKFYMPSSWSTESTYTQIVQGAVSDSNNTFTSAIISNAKKIIQDQSFSNMDGTSGTWNPVYAVPEDWCDITQLDCYNELALDLNEVTENSVDPETVDDDRQVGLTKWQIGNSAESPSVLPLHTDSNIHSVRVKYLMVDISRPWFDELLFASDGWYLPGQQKGFCSSGQNDGKGVMPLIPSSLIVGTDVTIEANWSSEDRQILDHAEMAQKQLSLGPFLVNPGSNNSNLHIIGWGMSLIPFSPQISKE